ncbi:MAG: hypothetical protein IPM37_06640 [Hahellaceae bacterium]|nr:hypothetical protein [Hahellaceae bacterium]
MSLEAVYEIIAKAKHAVLQNARYRDWLEERLNFFHRSIQMPAQDPILGLERFVLRYIDLAPRMLDCIDRLTREAGLAAQASPFLEAGQNFFLHSGLKTLEYTGLEGLLIRAYQTHRLIEELYDCNRSLALRPDLGLENTEVNLLVHQLIGEPFANELDDACQSQLRKVVNLSDYSDLNLAACLDQANGNEWQKLRQEWENLLPQNGISFQFNS